MNARDQERVSASVQLDNILPLSPQPERTQPIMDTATIDASRQPVTATLERSEIDEYARLSKELGISSPAVRVEELKAFFAENGITVYPLEKVDAYLREKVRTETKSEGHVWVWRPLRERDGVVNQQSRFSGYGHGDGQERVYAKPIPLPVLMTVKKIQDAFPEAQFHASDYAVRKPDPFLAVMIPGWFELFVIERWDEPGFRM